MTKNHAITDKRENSVLKGVSWTALSTVLRVVIAGGTLALISRLVSPPTMGLFGVGWAAASLGYTISMNSAAQGIIALPVLEKAHIAAAQLLTIVISFSITATLFAASPFISVFYGSGEFGYAFVLGALFVPAMSLGAVDVARAQRRLQFAHLAAIQTLAVLFAAITALLLAILGFELVSLFALQGLVGAYVFIMFRFLWRAPGFGRVTMRHLADVWKIGKHLSLGSLTGVLWQNIPQLVLARVASIEVVGLYVFSYRVVQMIFVALNGMVNTVVYPTFARLQATPTEVGKAFLGTVRITYFFLMLPLIVLAAAPKPFLLIYGGAQWQSADAILFYLVLMHMALALGANVFPTFAALRRPSVAWRWNLFLALVQGATVFVLARYGTVAIAQGLAATALVMPLAVYWLSRVAQFRMVEYARNMITVVAPLAPAIAIGNGLQKYVMFSPLGALISSALVALVVYLVLVFFLDRRIRLSAKDIARAIVQRVSRIGM